MELIILIGLQAAGKSTFYGNRFAATHKLISKDLLRNHKKPARRQMQLIEASLKAQHSVVIDNTNPTAEERELLIRLGHLYGAKVIGYYFEPQVSQSLERNKQRVLKAQVPDKAIYITAYKLVPPTYAEGFDKLYYVHIAGNSTPEDPKWVIEEAL